MPFSLHSFDAGEEIAQRLGARGIDVIATRVDGTQISAQFELDEFADGPGGLPDFETFTLPTSFSNLRQVELRGFEGPFATPDLFFIDNIYLARGPSLSAEIDIKPGSISNSINQSNRGVIPVAILGSETFDAEDVDVTTLAFGPDAAAPSHDLTKQGTFEDHFHDVNLDGFTDLVSHYQTQRTGISPEFIEACITGAMLDGTPFEYCDVIDTVPNMGDDAPLGTQ